MSCALVDVDGTLVGVPSCERLFFAYLARRRLIGAGQIASALRFALAQASRDGRVDMRRNKAYLAGLPIGAVVAHAETFIGEEVVQRMRPSVLRRLEAHRRRREPIALLTGTLDVLAEPLARRIGATAWSATRCASESGRFTDGAPLSHPFAEEKVSRAQELCASIGVSLGDCVAYADSSHDLPLLRAVGKPIAVWPDRLLASTARRAGWEIIGD